jgi:putative ABC transport system ATP-binding protein
MSLAVVARRLVKAYDTTVVLKEVSVDIFEGECIMLVGPSGSGKTTLLSIIGCVLRPDSGTIRMFGEDITALDESELPRLRRARIGFVFQGHNLIASLTALENVVFQLQMRGIGGAEGERQARELLERVGLSHRLNNMPREMSGGQRQRVAVARALAGSPRLVLADEPTASLDKESGLQVMQLFTNLAKERGVTLVVVTHDSRIFQYADRIEHLENGMIVPNEESSIPVVRVAHFWPKGSGT